jgi:adenosylmethionine-8-amino-7-oxononanoate aminotransferase
MAAILIDEAIAEAFKKSGGRFINAYTTAGNPVSCAVGLEVVRIIEKEKLVERSAKLGEYLHRKAREILLPHPSVGDVRGKGMLMGVELVKDKATKEPFTPELLAGPRVHQLAMKAGCMVFPTSGFNHGVSGDAIIIAPPLIISEEEIDTALAMVDEALTTFEKEQL